jgi:hypothetical protein
MVTASGSLPGADLVEEGLRALALGEESVAALVVRIGAPRLRALGCPVPESAGDRAPEHLLYERLAAVDPDAAHSRYNALIRRLVSFERAFACAR